MTATETPTAVQPRPRRRLRRILLWTLIPLAVIVVLLIVADIAVRAYAEQRAADEIEKSLPADVKGDVSVHIGGLSVIQQYLSGSFDRVELDAPHLTAKGVPLSANVVASGVPADLKKPVSSATGTFVISQKSLNALVEIPGAKGDITLGDGTVGYDGTIDLLGLPVGYTVTAKPEAAGDQVLLQPVDASLSTGSNNLDLTRLVKAITDRGPFPVCAAQYLPDGVQVSDIAVKKGEATVTFTAQDFTLDSEFMRSKGSCS